MKNMTVFLQFVQENDKSMSGKMVAVKKRYKMLAVVNITLQSDGFLDGVKDER